MTSPRSATPPSKQDINRYLQHVDERARGRSAVPRARAGERPAAAAGVRGAGRDRGPARRRSGSSGCAAEGVTVPPAADHKIGTRTMDLLQTARRHSPDLVLPIIERDERDGMSVYLDDPDAPEHLVSRGGRARPHPRPDADRGPRGRGRRGLAPQRQVRGATRRRSSGSTTAWSATPRWSWASPAPATDNKVVLLAGLSGLLAGAFSMGAGEYISMANQREAYEREIALERDEIKFLPDDERRELELIYRAKGLGEEEARAVAAPRHVGPRRRARHDGARGARARPRRPRVAVARRVLQLRRVRRSAPSSSCCPTCSCPARRRSWWASPSRWSR